MQEGNKPINTFHFISHTHWDREWFLPYENFRFRLVQLIDNLMELLDNDPEFKYFHLDGQTIVLEDYYAIRSWERGRLEAFIREGRILVGPWYQQNDLFLTSAESTVRNLMEGIRLSRELGGEMKIGYLPDHFGLLGQMPQIFQLVGIDNSVFGRGYDYELHQNPFLKWRSPDGSEVTGILMVNWYNNAQRIPIETESLKATFQLMQERESAVNPLPHYLMMNGVDHLEAQENLTAALDKLRVLYGDESIFIHDTLPNYVQTVQAYLAEHPSIPVAAVHGELRERFDYAILGGTLSSRIYLKQANLQCHDLIEKWAEPLSVWCAGLGLEAYDGDYFRYLWKLYMENHPHDSICGCSQDAVHEHMMDRFVSVKEIAQEIITRKMRLLANQVSEEGYKSGEQKLLIVNHSQLDSQSVMQATLYFLSEDEVEQFRIEDDAGVSIPYRIVDASPSRLQVTSPINLPGVLHVQRYDIELYGEIPAMGYTTYRIQANEIGINVSDQPQPQLAEIQAAVLYPVMENDSIRVEFNGNGSFHIIHKDTGTVYHNVGQFEEAGDAGDLYVYTSVDNECKQRWNGEVEFTGHIVNALYEECCYRFSWMLPKALNGLNMQRDSELASCSFEVTVRLEKLSSRLNVRVRIDNQVKDHRIRFICELPDVASEVWAGGQFDVVQRKWDEGKQFERDCNAQPYWKWVAPRQVIGGLTVFGVGMHEYEMIDEGSTLAVTLLRCVESINMREAIQLENDIQPQGQCIGQHTFMLALRPFTAETATQLYKEAELFHQGVLMKLSPVKDPRWDQGRAWVQDSKLGGSFTRPDPNAAKPKLPRSGSFMQINGDVLISAVKWAENRQGPVIRLYNVEQTESWIGLGLTAGSCNGVVRTNLLEEETGDAMKLDGLKLLIAPKKIETFKIY
ncbi:hypothetical protein EHS13_33305 [Paenibacillus psychroresistens]|uniref:Glycoside hydrolase family 38 central domain-containing protein n=1 Tax=Paenibacillus psychroresistens TaxID=1778678 RepID=A0A6B8RUT8_9BACL|nr:glycosyl hydrolase-related protein [Paenibacillus psychroresistens]QGQ99395.1 hypothetical protein EHS13_33305 [Paenibacillus psychroresistens]